MTRVVLLGGGYVTLHVCAQLRRRLRGPLRRGEVELVVISAEKVHHFHGFTGEVLAGLMPVERTRTPLDRSCRPARLVHGTAEAVDRQARTVTVRPHGSGERLDIDYDHLVVGTGSREPSDTVPGLAEHGRLLRGPGDLDRLVDEVDTLAETGSATVIVAGGGLAGCELAAALADRGQGRIGVHLIHPGVELAPALAVSQPRLVRRIGVELDRLGVQRHPGTRLAAVSPGIATLSDGRTLTADLVLGTVGQRPVALPGLDDDLRDEPGRLHTDPDLRVIDTVWAAGDVARVRHRGTGRPVPANALWAIKGGAHLGRNLARELRGRRTRPFRYRGLGQAASFGQGRAIGELYGVPFTGVVAWLLRLTFFLRFLPDRRRVPTVLADTARTLRGQRWDGRTWRSRRSGTTKPLVEAGSLDQGFHGGSGGI